MLEQNFQSVYEKFKLQFFRRLFSPVSYTHLTLPTNSLV